MSFDQLRREFNPDHLDDQVNKVKKEDVKRVLNKDVLKPDDFMALLSPAALPFLEQMAQKAHETTIRNFGKTILLYTPMYLANYCVNQCLYCGFNSKNEMARSRLTMDEIDREGRKIASSGLKHILVLTGESRAMSPVDYIKDAVIILKRYFTSIAVEIYPLETEEYHDLIEAGVDSLTLYQETYHEALYDLLHVSGPKKNYAYRIEAPERACKAGMRAVNIGALLGLDVFHRDMFMTGLHAWYLQKNWPDVDISVSFPRIRPFAGSYIPENPVSDHQMVQALTAMRLFLPRGGITISTRETAEFRNNILPLGVTRMSAGSTTVVGGHTRETEDTGQFNISDERSVTDMALSLSAHGYQPVYKDWHPI